MIPRHQPAYTWQQWRKALDDARDPAVLEHELAARMSERLTRRHALFYARGRDAMFAWAQLAATDREIYIPAFTCCVVPEALTNAHAKVKFVDVNDGTINTEPEQLAEVQPSAGAFFLMTHQWGNPCRAGELLAMAQAKGLRVVEDAAAALGAATPEAACGALGEVSFVSFENTKLLGSGQLGVLLTNDDALAEQLRLRQSTFHTAKGIARRTAVLKLINQNWCYAPVLKAFTWRAGDHFSDHGVQHALDSGDYARKPDRFALALALAQWDDLNARLLHRERLREIYQSELAGCSTLKVNADASPCLIRMPIRVADKRQCYRRMLQCGIDLGWSFDYIVAPAAESARYPVAARIAQTVLNLPIHEGVTAQQAKLIADAVREFALNL
jgi:dTDP-4-amino-4,6-dideoxygalactose transaminase